MTSSNDDTGYEYEIDWIMKYRKWNEKKYYYIHWKEYPMDDNIWESKENLNKIILRDWEHQNREKWRKNKSTESRSMIP